MTGSKAAGGGVTVVYTYTYGCKNTFTLTLTPGSDPAPGQVTSNECSYTATWAGLAAGAAAASCDPWLAYASSDTRPFLLRRCVQPACRSSPYRPLRSSVWAWQRSLVGPALTSSSVACRAQRPYLLSTSGAHYLPSSWRAPGSPSITRESFL